MWPTPQSTDNLHHAYLLVGDRETGEEAVLDLLRQLDIELAHNPDVAFFRAPTLTIDEARALKARAERKSFGGKKIFVILSETINREAQHALLKTLEEPTSDTHFFLVALHPDLLLPTLQSRMSTVRLAQEIPTEEGPSKFLAMTPAKRVAFAKKFADSERPLGAFLDALVAELRAQKAPLETQEKVFTIRRYADDQAALPRLVLEHLALVLE